MHLRKREFKIKGLRCHADLSSAWVWGKDDYVSYHRQ
jgi:hypothetical protein